MSEWNDIGEELRNKREKSGLILADISHKLRIPTATLKALEINDYSHFASPAYAKSFLKQYSEYLDIDAEAWLQSFDTSTVLSDLDSYKYLKPDPLDQPRDSGSSGIKNRQDGRSPNIMPLVLFLLSATLIGGLFYGYIYIDKLINESISPDTPVLPPNVEKNILAPITPKNPPSRTTPPPVPIVSDEETPAPVRPVVIPDDTPIPRAILVPEDGSAANLEEDPDQE